MLRRAKEAALREREEYERYAKQLVEEEAEDVNSSLKCISPNSAHFIAHSSIDFSLKSLISFYEQEILCN